MSRWPGRSKQAKTTFGGLSRSALMSRIRSSLNATTELKLLSLLRAARLKGWRRNYPLPGKPDFTFPKSKLVVFVDGCFWHGCPIHETKPKSNRVFWNRKLSGNKKRDRMVTRTLRKTGWRVLRIWEHQLARKNEPRLIRCIQCALNRPLRKPNKTR
jgi:DNA mismatch endonuclease (patch repair protein)